MRERERYINIGFSKLSVADRGRGVGGTGAASRAPDGRSKIRTKHNMYKRNIAYTQTIIHTNR